MLFFWFFKNCELIRDSSLWHSNFIPLVRDSIIITGSRCYTYTFGSRFDYKRWVRVFYQKSEFQLSWASIPILFVGSQSVSIEVPITCICANWHLGSSISTFHVPIGTPRVLNGLLGAELVFEFWSNLDSFFEGFLVEKFI